MGRHRLAALARRRRQPPARPVHRCGACGFAPPAPGELATALRRGADVWDAALRTDPEGHAEAADHLHDEVEAALDALDRVLPVDPGGSVRGALVTAPRTSTGAVDPERAGRLLRFALERAAGSLEALSPAGSPPPAAGRTALDLLHQLHARLATGAPCGRV